MRLPWRPLRLNASRSPSGPEAARLAAEARALDSNELELGGAERRRARGAAQGEMVEDEVPLPPSR